MSIETENIIVQEDVQEHFIIKDREIIPNPNPKFDNNILVTYDNKSNRLYFNMFYTFDDRTLNDKVISIVWINANNERGTSSVEDVTLTGEKLTFSWNVPVEATYKAGTIYFAIHITTTNYVWNSLAGTVVVREGLITESFNHLDDAEYIPGWIDYIEGSDIVHIRKLTQTEYDNIETKSDSILYLVLTEDDKVYQYLGTKLVSGGAAEDDSEDTKVCELTAVDSSKVAGSTYVDYYRTQDNYRVYYRENLESAPLELEYASLSANDISTTSLSKSGYYYIFSLTPFSLENGRFTFTWLGGYTINSIIYVTQQYIFCETSEFPTNLQPSEILSPDTPNAPHDPPVNLVGSGHYTETPLGTTVPFTGIGDTALARTSGYVFCGCVIRKPSSGSMYVIKNTMPDIRSDATVSEFYKKLQYNNEDFLLELPISDGIFYNNLGQLTNRMSTTYLANSCTNITSPSVLSVSSTSSYWVLTCASNSTEPLSENATMTWKNIHTTPGVTWYSASALANMELTLEDGTDYYIICSTPVSATKNSMIVSGFSGTYTINGDGIDIQPFLIGWVSVTANSLFTSGMTDITLTGKSLYFGETQHLSKTTTINFATSTGECLPGCAYENFIFDNPNLNLEGKSTFRGVRIRKCGNCNSFKIDRTGTSLRDGYGFYRNVKLSEYVPEDISSQPHLSTGFTDLTSVYSTPFLLPNHDGINHLTYNNTTISLNSLSLYAPRTETKTCGVLQTNKTDSAFPFRVTIPVTYDVSELDSGTYYVGIRPSSTTVSDIPLEAGLIMFSKVSLRYSSDAPEVSEFSNLNDNEIVFVYNPITHLGYECTKQYVLQLTFLAGYGSYIFGKFTWNKESQVITNFERTFIGKLEHPTVAYTQFLIDCNTNEIVSQFTEKINTLQNTITELETKLINLTSVMETSQIRQVDNELAENE